MREPRLQAAPEGPYIVFSQLHVSELQYVASGRELVPTEECEDGARCVQFAQDYARRLLKERGM